MALLSGGDDNEERLSQLEALHAKRTAGYVAIGEDGTDNVSSRVYGDVLQLGLSWTKQPRLLICAFFGFGLVRVVIFVCAPLLRQILIFMGGRRLPSKVYGTVWH